MSEWDDAIAEAQRQIAAGQAQGGSPYVPNALRGISALFGGNPLPPGQLPGAVDIPPGPTAGGPLGPRAGFAPAQPPYNATAGQPSGVPFYRQLANQRAGAGLSAPNYANPMLAAGAGAGAGLNAPNYTNPMLAADAGGGAGAGLSAPNYTNPMLAAGAGAGAGLSAPNYTNPFLAAGATPGAGLDSPTLIPAPGGGRTIVGAFNPNAPATNARPASGVRSAGAAAPADRFRMFQYDVAGTPGATQLPGGAGRAGQNRSPYITALDLSHLFGGGQPAAGNPANVPAANVQPMRGGPLSKGFTTKAPWDYGPIQKGRSWPQGPDYSDIPVGYHSGYQ